MNIKSITSLALAAGAVACISAAPAQAFGFYVQTPFHGYDSAPYYNPYAYPNYGYGFNAQTPWYGGAGPYPYGYGSGFINPYGGWGGYWGHHWGGYYGPHFHHHHRW
jgi:hypothetical protein